MATESNLKVGILLVGFNPFVLKGLQAILQGDERTEIIGHVRDGDAAVPFIREANASGKKVGVVLTETRSHNVDGITTTRLVTREFPDIHVVVLTQNPNDSLIIDAIEAGATGYVFLDEASPDSLLQIIHESTDGNTHASSLLLRRAVDNLIQNGRKTLVQRVAEAAHLTEREIDVLRLLGNGETNKAIAGRLGITLDTTKKHVRAVIRKLQVSNRTKAAIIGAQAGIAVELDVMSIRTDKQIDIHT